LRRRPPVPFTAQEAGVDTLVKSGHRGSTDGGLLDELAAYRLMERLGIACAPAIALDADIARAPALPFPYPVAVKALSAEIAHKTEIGGVVLGIRDGEALLAAIRTIRDTVAARAIDIPIDRVLVQPMVSGLGEV